MKKNRFLWLTFFCFATVNSQIADGVIDDPGDIVIIAYHDTPDGFSFVFLDDCLNGTEIRFVDEEWTGSNFASASTEGEVLWINNTSQTLLAGTVVHIENANDNNPGIMASVGVASEVDGGFSTDTSEDEVIAISGTRSNPGDFLTFYGDADTAGSVLPAVLTNGVTALMHSNAAEGYYSGVDNCDGLSLTACARQLNNLDNWTFGSYNYPSDAMMSLGLSNVLKAGTLDNNSLKFYPNPVLGKMYISSLSHIKEVSLFNLLGIEVLRKKLNSKKAIIDLSMIPKGNYYMKCNLNRGEAIFLVQKIE